MTNVKARILLWGIEGAGKTTTLKTIHGKLRGDLRGEMRREPTRLDPTVFSETLPITLGEVGGVGTQIELVAVPGAPDQAMTRKQLLDEVDGLILVIDASPEKIDQNTAAIEELRASLDAYGRTLETFPIVLQYNKRDVADPFAIEALHRKIGLDQSAVFETIATTGHGILPTLTTISKFVVRARRGSSQEIDPALAQTPGSEDPLEQAPELAADLMIEDEEIEISPLAESEPDTAPLSSAELLESAILAEGDDEGFQTLGAIEMEGESGWDAANLDPGEAKPALGQSLRVVSVGQAETTAEGGVRLPLVLGDENGESRSVVLSLRLDALQGGND